MIESIDQFVIVFGAGLYCKMYANAAHRTNKALTGQLL
jgi:hypothetical protein